MKINATYSRLASGEKIIGAYKISLTKSKTEQAGFVNGEDVDVKYLKNKIIITKKEPVVK